ncbi:MAG: alcohol dehydrogenase catalytic domain-containing protein, partial [Chloroflexi bacterium]|nr:alcohol dehydrogenase catalytic domain-containing protein [Chloroflexota bacterium]
MMRAAVFHGPHRPLSIEEVEIDTPGPREMIVRTVASGVCRSDAHYVDGLYAWPAPAVLGHEASGIVEQVGALVTQFAPGDHVIANLSVFCGSCERCITGHPNLCRLGGRTRDLRENPPLKRGDEAVTAMTNVGGFAEMSLTPAGGLLKIPDDVGMDVASLVGCSVMTGYGAVVNTAAVEPGSTVAVIGTGGVGLN